MNRIKINAQFESLLNQHGLNSVQAFMSFDDGDILEENNKRDTRRITLGDEVFYLKRTKVEKTSSAIERLLMLGIPHSKPFNEAIHIEKLNNASINTMTVAAAGEALSLGLPTSGFILSHQVAGKELESLFQQSDEDTRQAITQAFGELLATLHSKGFFGTLRLKDIFCNGDVTDKNNYQLIDRETRNPFPKRYSHKRAIDSLKNGFRRQKRDGSGFNESEFKTLINSYCAVLNINSQNKQQALLELFN